MMKTTFEFLTPVYKVGLPILSQSGAAGATFKKLLEDTQKSAPQQQPGAASPLAGPSQDTLQSDNTNQVNPSDDDADLFEAQGQGPQGAEDPGAAEPAGETEGTQGNPNPTGTPGEGDNTAKGTEGPNGAQQEQGDAPRSLQDLEKEYKELVDGYERLSQQEKESPTGKRLEQVLRDIEKKLEEKRKEKATGQPGGNNPQNPQNPQNAENGQNQQRRQLQAS